MLLLKAGNFNVVRSCQHVEFPEVLECMDRVGMMSEQDQGGGYNGSIDMGIRREPHIHTGTVLARRLYNNPGVVLLTFGNEHDFPTEPILRAALAVDPQRIFKPISGRFSHSPKPWDLPDDLRANAIDDGHPYSGWYGTSCRKPGVFCRPGRRGGWSRSASSGPRPSTPTRRCATTTRRSSSRRRRRRDTLWAASQVQKHDVRQIVGLGRNPKNLAEYIEASQNYQEALAGRQGDRHAAFAAGDRRLFPFPFHRRRAGVLAEVDRQPRSSARRKPTTSWPSSISRSSRCRNSAARSPMR